MKFNQFVKKCLQNHIFVSICIDFTKILDPLKKNFEKKKPRPPLFNKKGRVQIKNIAMEPVKNGAGNNQKHRTFFFGLMDKIYL